MLSNSSKINSYINFAIKAGKIILGQDEIEKNLKICKLILYFEDLSDSSLKKLNLLAEKIKIMKLSDSIFYLTKKNVKVFAITDENLAKAILNL